MDVVELAVKPTTVVVGFFTSGWKYLKCRDCIAGKSEYKVIEMGK